MRFYGLRQQPTPRHDWINFKEMKDNEILLNMENYENFHITELFGGLLELTRRDPNNELELSTHPWVEPCLEKLKILQP